MAKNRRGGGRTTPKGTRPGVHAKKLGDPPSQSELLLRDARHMAHTRADIDEVEQWASAIQSVFRPHGHPPMPGTSPKSVLRDARLEGGVAAAVLASAMAVYGPATIRQDAAKLAAKLISGGVEVPSWVEQLGRVEPTRVMMLTDIWNEGCSIHLDCIRDGRTVGVGTTVDAIGGLVAHGFTHGPTTKRLEKFASGEADMVVTEIDPADARATVEAALAMADETADFMGEPDPDDHDPDLRALIEQRFSLLPSGGTSLMQVDDIESAKAGIIAAFLARPGASSLPDVEDIADTICDFSGYCDGDPLLWSPTRVKTFLSIWIPAKVIADAEWHSNLTTVLPEWIRYAAEAKDLPDHALSANLAAIDPSARQMRRNLDDPDMASPGSALIRELLDNGIDPTDGEATQKWIDDHARPPAPN